MRKRAVILLAWWFLAFGSYGGMSGTGNFTPVGLFNDKFTCSKIAEWAKGRASGVNGAKPEVSECWSDGKY